MRFILRKFVDAETAAAALDLDKSTPVHDVYLKEGEEPKRDNTPRDTIGFWHPEEPSLGYIGEPIGKKR
jgi:hypothetical protein